MTQRHLEAPVRRPGDERRDVVGPRRDWRRLLPDSLAGRVLVVYLALRALSWVLLVLASHEQVVMRDWTGPTVEPIDMTVLWDGSWYRTVALHGYPVPLPVDASTGLVAQNAWAFYPLFPLVSRVIMSLTGLGFPAVGSSVALLCGLGAAVLMARLLAERVGQGAALATVAVWAAVPPAVTLQLAYADAMAMMWICATLWALARRAWWWSGVFVLLLGLTRPVAPAMAVVVLVAVVHRWRSRTTQPLGRRELLAALGALAASGLASMLWPLVAWAVTGRPTAYLDTQAAWRSGQDVVPLRPWLEMSRWVFRDSGHAATYGPVALAALLTAIVVLTCGPWATRLGPELRAWSLAYPAYLLLVLQPFTSVFRHALPLFPLVAVVVAGWPGRQRWLWARAGPLVAAGAVGQVAWVWKLLVYHPPSDFPP